MIMGLFEKTRQDFESLYEYGEHINTMINTVSAMPYAERVNLGKESVQRLTNEMKALKWSMNTTTLSIHTFSYISANVDHKITEAEKRFLFDVFGTDDITSYIPGTINVKSFESRLYDFFKPLSMDGRVALTILLLTIICSDNAVAYRESVFFSKTIRSLLMD